MVTSVSGTILCLLLSNTSLMMNECAAFIMRCIPETGGGLPRCVN